MASVLDSSASAACHHSSHQKGWSDKGWAALKMEEMEAKHEEKLSLFKKYENERKNFTHQASKWHLVKLYWLPICKRPFVFFSLSENDYSIHFFFFFWMYSSLWVWAGLLEFGSQTLMHVSATHKPPSESAGK